MLRRNPTPCALHLSMLNAKVIRRMGIVTQRPCSPRQHSCFASCSMSSSPTRCCDLSGSLQATGAAFQVHTLQDTSCLRVDEGLRCCSDTASSDHHVRPAYREQGVWKAEEALKRAGRLRQRLREESALRLAAGSRKGVRAAVRGAVEVEGLPQLCCSCLSVYR